MPCIFFRKVVDMNNKLLVVGLSLSRDKQNAVKLVLLRFNSNY